METQVLCRWLNEELRLSRIVEPKTFAKDFSSGYLMGEVLHKYNLQNDFSLFLKKDTTVSKLNNFTRLEPTLRLLRISFDTVKVQDLMDEKPGVAIRLLYQLYASLEKDQKAEMSATMELTQPAASAGQFKKDHEIFSEVMKRDAELKLHKISQHYGAKGKAIQDLRDSVDSNLTNMRVQQSINRPVENQFIHQRRSLKVQEDKKKSADVNIQIPKPPAKNSALKKKQQLQQRKERQAEMVKAEIAQFEMKKRKQVTSSFTSLPSSSGQPFPRDYHLGLSRKGVEVSGGEKKLTLQSNAKYLQEIRQRLEENAVACDQRDKRLNNFLMEQFKARDAHEEAQREEQLIARLTRQTRQEQRLAAQLLQLQKQKDVIRENRLLREQQYEERREKDFQEALDREAALAQQAKLEHADDIRMQLELCKRMAAERVQSRHIKHSHICADILEQILDLATKIGEYRLVTGNLIPEKQMREWKELLFKGLPLYEPLKEPVEKEKQEILNNQDYDDYTSFSGGWTWLEEAGEEMSPPLNNDILGHAVERLRANHHPPSVEEPSSPFPPFTIKACVLSKYCAGKTACLATITEGLDIHILSADTLVKEVLNSYKKESQMKSNSVVTEQQEGENNNNNQQLLTPLDSDVDHPREKDNNTNLSSRAMMGARAEKELSEGNTISNELLMEIITEAIREVPTHSGFILDGFPLDITQAQLLENAFCDPSTVEEEKTDTRLNLAVDPNQQEPPPPAPALDLALLLDFSDEQMVSHALSLMEAEPEASDEGIDQLSVEGTEAEPEASDEGIDQLSVEGTDEDDAVPPASQQAEKLVDNAQVSHGITAFQDAWPELDEWFGLKQNILVRVDADVEEFYSKVKSVLQQVMEKKQKDLKTTLEAVVEPVCIESAPASLVTSGAEDQTSGAEDKTSGAEDKTSGAEDKTSGAEDKTSGAEDKTSGAEDKTSGAEDKTSGAEDKTSGAEDKTSGAKDKTSGAKDKTSGAKDKRSGAEDKRSEAEDKTSGAKDKTSGAKDKRSGAKDKRSGAEDKRSEAEDKTSGAEDKRSEAEDKTSGAEDKSASSSLSTLKGENIQCDSSISKAPAPSQNADIQSESPASITDQPLLPEISKNLSPYWDMVCQSYVNNVKTLMERLRYQRNIFEQQNYIIRERFKHMLGRSDSRQELVSQMQKNFNSIPDDMRNDEENKTELHLRLDELLERLWDISDKRKEEDEKERETIMNDGWLKEQVSVVIELHSLLMQVELDRFQETVFILRMYYCSMCPYMRPILPSKMFYITLMNSPNNEEVKDLDEGETKSPRPDSSVCNQSDEDKKMKLLPLKRIFEPSETSSPPPTEKSTRKKKSSKQNDKRTKDSPQEKSKPIEKKNIVPLQPHEKLMEDYDDTITVITHLMAAETQKLKESNPEKEQTDAESEKTPSQQQTGVESPSIDSASSKNSKTFNDQEVKDKIQQEHQDALQHEENAAKARIALVKGHGLVMVRSLESGVDECFASLEKRIKDRYVKEMKSIDDLSEVFRHSIEAGMKLQNELILGSCDFYLNADHRLVPNPPPPVHPPTSEKPSGSTLTVVQLESLNQQLRRMAPSGLIYTDEFLCFLKDYALIKKGRNPVLEQWIGINETQWRDIVFSLTDDQGLVDWRRFLLSAALPWPHPSLSQLLEVFEKFKTLNTTERIYITEEQYTQTELWFSGDSNLVVPEDPLEPLPYDRLSNLRRFFFQLFADHEATPPKLDYVHMLLYFAADPNPRTGFIRALSLMLGQHIKDSSSSISSASDLVKSMPSIQESSELTHSDLDAEKKEDMLDEVNPQVSISDILDVFFHKVDKRTDSKDQENLSEQLRQIFRELESDPDARVPFSILSKHPFTQSLMENCKWYQLINFDRVLQTNQAEEMNSFSCNGSMKKPDKNI